MKRLTIFFALLLLCAVPVAVAGPQHEKFGGWSISHELYQYILKVLPAGKTILEFGSGWASSQLSKHYTVYSVEHNPLWVNRYNTNYIHARIVNGWYDVKVLKQKLPQHYDLILVDGPPGNIGRGKFLDHLALFNTASTIIIFDDINREPEHQLMRNVAKALKREFVEITDSANKKFGVLL